MTRHVPEWRPRIARNPHQVRYNQIEECRNKQKSMSHGYQGVDNTKPVSTKMIRTRDDFYQPGIPAVPGHHYNAFVRFARKHAGSTILDLGCGFGAYSGALTEAGLNCFGCDINFDYLRKASASGLPVANVDSLLPFSDRSFDTVLIFEVLEHVTDPNVVLREAFRVARKNVLITVPNSEDIERMKANDVTYAHMLSSDHLHFFDPDSLAQLLRGFSKNLSIERADPIYPFWFLSRSLPFYGLKLLFRLGLLKPRFFSRLYAVASIREN
jgi:2-polyprenyl-3-methyl-5-hydroxy-6-metoxy-1,4-benzoquinol methylase